MRKIDLLLGLGLLAATALLALAAIGCVIASSITTLRDGFSVYTFLWLLATTACLGLAYAIRDIYRATIGAKIKV